MTAGTMSKRFQSAWRLRPVPRPQQAPTYAISTYLPRTMPFATADLYDAHADEVQVLTPMLRSLGGQAQVHGKIYTLKLHEDNSLVRQALSEPGEGQILVVDGGGSLRCALVGDNLAQLAIDQGWAGIVVYGCIRDAVLIAQMDLGVWALATTPVKSIKRNVGLAQAPVTFGGVTFRPGAYLYADSDGILVAPRDLLAT